MSIMFRGKEYVPCIVCGQGTAAEDYEHNNGLCLRCWEKRHVCAGCDNDFVEELPPTNGDKLAFRYCNSCYREIAEQQILASVLDIRKLAEQARKTLIQANERFIECDKPNYLEYVANAAGHLVYLCGQLEKIARDLEVF